MSKINSTPFLRLLPDSLKRDPDMIAAASSLDGREIFNSELQHLMILFDPSTLKYRDKKLLDYLYRQEHVDLDSIELDNEKKAGLIYMSPAIHMRKGTAWAVQQVVSTVIAKAEVTEWYEYGGDPYKFRVDIKTDRIEKGEIRRIHQVVNAAKNERSLMEDVVILVASPLISMRFRSYTFPVTYPITNLFGTAGVPGRINRDGLRIDAKSYQWEVKYPITNLFQVAGRSIGFGEKIGVEARSYVSRVVHHRTGTIRAGEEKL